MVKAWILSHLLQLIVGPLVGVITFYCHEQIQNAIVQAKASPAWMKRLASVVLVSLLTAGANAFGFVVPAACEAGADVVACLTAIADKGWLSAAVGVVVAEFTHRAIKKRK